MKGASAKARLVTDPAFHAFHAQHHHRRRQKEKAPNGSGLQLNVFRETALPVGKAAALEYACLQKS